MADVTFVIPTIPPRANVQLPRAIRSAATQTVNASAMSIACDTDREGAARTRQRALDPVRTEWVAFLDDNDELMPHHLETLLELQAETNADYVYSRYSNERNTHPDPMPRYSRFTPENPPYPCIMALVRTELAQTVGFTSADEHDIVGNEDHRFLMRCVAAGASVVYTPEETWWWWRDVSTNGIAQRWNPGMLRYDPTW